MKKNLTPSERAEAERIEAAERKYGRTPDRLRIDEGARKVPCDSCGRPTIGAGHEVRPTVGYSGEYIPPAPKLCDECSPSGTRAKNIRRFAAERRSESYKARR